MMNADETRRLENSTRVRFTPEMLSEALPLLGFFGVKVIGSAPAEGEVCLVLAGSIVPANSPSCRLSFHKDVNPSEPPVVGRVPNAKLTMTFEPYSEPAQPARCGSPELVITFDGSIDERIRRSVAQGVQDAFRRGGSISR